MTANLTTLLTFNSTDGAFPGGLVADGNGDLFGTTQGGSAGLVDGTVFELVNNNGTYTLNTLVTFNGGNGPNPTGLIADANGDLFDTTAGSVFELVNNNGTYTLNTLSNFGGGNKLLADANGDFFGTTAGGGSNNDGTAFELVNNNGAYTVNTLVNFNGSNGSEPYSGLIADANGDLFGTTAYGGLYQGITIKNGTVFELVNNNGTYTVNTLVNFNGAPNNGSEPYAGLIADANGDLFGTTDSGGPSDAGTVFELVNNNGTYTLNTLVNFNGSNGLNPYAGLIADANGDLFGTTGKGGSNNDGTVFELVNNNGAYTLNTLVNFNGIDGAIPKASLIADANGNLFGTTQAGGPGPAGGPNYVGTVFEITNSGFVTVQPTLIAVTETPSSGDFNAGNKVTITLTTSGAVTVTGTPTLTFNDGATAIYDAAKSTATSLVFDYTVTSSDRNVASLAVTSINLPNGATIQNGGGNNLNLSLSSVPTYSGPQIDTTIPAVTAVAETPSTGTLNAGKTVTITLTTSEAVTLTGTPTLALNDHGMATYSGISTDGKTLTFAYTVASADIDVASLQVSSINLPNGATIRDGGGNNLDPSLSAVPTYSGPAVDLDKVAEVPSLMITGNVTVSAGGSKPLGITASPVDSDDTMSITIKGVPSYEKITAGPGETVTTNTAKGKTTYTITSTTPGAAITDLTLTSTYTGKKSVMSTFTVTASDTTSGETATSVSKSVTVTDPPILATNENIIGGQLLGGAPPTSPPGLDHVVALFSQSIAAGFSDQPQHGVLNTNPLSQIVTNQEQFLANPHHG
jgi:uncharacterized repeat protein (TIGR03803 family)